MFNVDGKEFVFLVLLALVFLGPEKLPDLFRRVGKAYSEFRRMSESFQEEFRNAVEEPIAQVRETQQIVRESTTFTSAAPRRAPAVAESENRAGEPSSRSEGGSTDSLDSPTHSSGGSDDERGGALAEADGESGGAEEAESGPPGVVTDNQSADDSTNGAAASSSATPQRGGSVSPIRESRSFVGDRSGQVDSEIITSDTITSDTITSETVTESDELVEVVVGRHHATPSRPGDSAGGDSTGGDDAASPDERSVVEDAKDGDRSSAASSGSADRNAEGTTE